MEPIYILGGGAVGLPLAAFLAHAGRNVVAVRTSTPDLPLSKRLIKVELGTDRLDVEVESASLAQLPHLNGTLVITAKAYANASIAAELLRKHATGPVVLLQNGLAVERPFVEAGFADIYRCVLYLTSQTRAENAFTFRSITSCPIGTVRGNPDLVPRLVETLSTPGLTFHADSQIERQVWKKAFVNCVFNSICPLLDVDNGIFARDPEVAKLAAELIEECVSLSDRMGLGLTAAELMQQIMLISSNSKQLISTLQDLRNGRPTEIESLNLEIARVARSQEPPVPVSRVELLGRMILAKSGISSAAL